MIVRAVTDHLSINASPATLTLCLMKENVFISALTPNMWMNSDIVIGVIPVAMIVMALLLKTASRVGLDTILPIMSAIRTHVQVPPI